MKKIKLKISLKLLTVLLLLLGVGQDDGLLVRDSEVAGHLGHPGAGRLHDVAGPPLARAADWHNLNPGPHRVLHTQYSDNLTRYRAGAAQTSSELNE